MSDLVIDKDKVMSSNVGVTQLDIHRIMDMIPHRYPFLMVDKIIDIVTGESATGVKNVTINEPFFQGHFPGHPVMPGVLIVESMAQTAGVLVVHTLGKASEGKLVYFMSIEEAKFRKPVIPGDTLHVQVKKDKQRGNVWKFNCEAYVGTTKVAEGAITAMIMD